MTLLFSIFGLLFASCSSRENEDAIQSLKFQEYRTQALSYCEQNKMNTEYYFLVDFSIHSGRNRFFIYNFKDSTILKSALVTHGTCDGLTSNPDPNTVT